MTHAPRRGVGTATVKPIRSRKDIDAIKGRLSQRPRDFALFVLGVNVGLRGSDLLRLRWGDVLGADGRIVAKLVVIEQKTKKQREVALAESPRKALQSWLQEVGSPSREAYVFPNRDGGPLTIQRLHQLVRQWTRSAGVEGHFGTHTLRKTYGLQLRKNGTPLETLMKAFGHSSQSITLRYIGLEQQDIDDANLKLNL
jgi:integrase